MLRIKWIKKGYVYLLINKLKGDQSYNYYYHMCRLVHKYMCTNLS